MNVYTIFRYDWAECRLRQKASPGPLIPFLRKKMVPWLLTIFLSLVALNPMYDAAAFECGDLSSPSRFVICSDPKLIKLADERQKAFDEALARLDAQQRDELLADQRAWVNSYPSTCGVILDRPPPNPVPKTVSACFKRAADARLAYIRAYAAGGAMADVASNPTSTTRAFTMQGSPERIGPSFDCEKAVQPIDQMICADPTLSRLDLEFVQAYQTLRYHVGEAGQGQLRQEALEFHNAVVRHCGVPGTGPITGSSDCVRSAYKQQRIKWLSRLAGPALEEARRPIERHFDFQLTLRNLGLINTQPDGVYGSDTRSAIMAFQGSHGLTITGFLSDVDASVINREVTARHEVSTRNEASSKQSMTPSQDTVAREPRASVNTSGPQTPPAPDPAIRPSPPIGQNSLQQDRPDPPRTMQPPTGAATPSGELSAVDCMKLYDQASAKMQGGPITWYGKESLLDRPLNAFTKGQIDDLITSAQKACGRTAPNPQLLMTFVEQAKKRVNDIYAAREVTERLEKKGALGVSCSDLQKSLDRMAPPRDAAGYKEISTNFPYLAVLEPPGVDQLRELSDRCSYDARTPQSKFIQELIGKYLKLVRETKVFEKTGVPTCLTINDGRFLADEKKPMESLPLIYFHKLVETARSCDSWKLDEVMALAVTRRSLEIHRETGLPDAIELLARAQRNLASVETEYRNKKFFFFGSVERIAKTADAKEYVYVVRPFDHTETKSAGHVECRVRADDKDTIRKWAEAEEGKALEGIGVILEITTKPAVGVLGLPASTVILRASCAPSA